MKLRYSRRAAHDLESIREYLSERSTRGAANVLAAIYLSIEFIRRNPGTELAQLSGVPEFAPFNPDYAWPSMSASRRQRPTCCGQKIDAMCKTDVWRGRLLRPGKADPARVDF